MKRIATILLTILVAGIASLSASNLITEKRTVKPFKAIDVTHGLTVEYYQGAQEQITVTAPRDLLKYVRTYVKDNTLYVNLDPAADKDLANYSITSKCKVRVSAPKLISMKAYDSGTFICRTQIRHDGPLAVESSDLGVVIFNSPVSVKEFAVSASNTTHVAIHQLAAEQAAFESAVASKITVDNCAADQVSITAEGAAIITIAGKADNVGIYASGSSIVNARNFDIRILTAESRTGSQITAKGTKRNSTSTSGGGKILK